MSNVPIKPENSRWTNGQWQGIYEKGQSILVSASAGSGKTTVLVKRVIEKVKAGDNVDELLIVTYTEAAAKEMKQRIQTAIQEAITNEGEPEMKQHLVNQISLLANANISTLHAFCLQVIRRYYYLIDMDPVFRLLTDETEMLLLKEDVWQEVRENLYGEENTLFYQLTASFSGDRSDEGLTKLIFSLYEFARSNPNPEKWLRQLSRFYDLPEDTPIGETALYQQLLHPQILIAVNAMLSDGKEAVSLSEQDDALLKQRELVTKEYQQIQYIFDSITSNQYEKASTLVRDMLFDRFPVVKKTADDEVKEVNGAIKEARDRYKKMFTALKDDYFYASPKKIKEMMTKMLPLIEEMARVTLLFSEKYWLEKQERGILDFNDLEHLTLRILATEDQGTWLPTEASSYYRAKFKEVLVDEYQDINALQENIVKWLVAEEADQGNLFMVGDVKQSIYSFRLANPALFLSKYETFGRNEGGKRIVLAENFRSRGEVLDFTNLIFEQLMDLSVGQMAYDEPAHLITGFPDFPESHHHQPELLIYESGEEDKQVSETEDIEGASWDMQIDDKTDGEIRMVGLKIKEMIGQQLPLYDKGAAKSRPIRYKDIVLLTPTKKNNLVLLDIFKQMDIPLFIQDTQNYFQTTEIKIMMALLQIIDNPYQDIPLAAVLRSPIVGLDENEMAFIRISRKTGNYYQAVVHFYENYKGNQIETDYAAAVFEKICLFMERLVNWRETARRNKLVQLIWDIYQETGFLDYVGGMSAGKQRQGNLHALYDRASQYEKMSFKSLFQFVRFIEKMQEKDKDLAEPTSFSQEEDAVRVMTIHASKGLEFPVVFILDATKGFNLTDVRSQYVFDENYGIGIPFVDLDTRLTYPTLVENALKERKKNKLLSEEMRKLYVALTRAEEKLFIVGSYKNEESAWKDWLKPQRHPTLVLPGAIRVSAKHMMSWIGMSLVRHPLAQDMQQEAEVAILPELKNHPAQFGISFYHQTDLQESLIAQTPHKAEHEWLNQVNVLKPVQLKEPLDPQTLEKITKLMDYTYEHENATRTTSYQSVSEIKRLFEEPDDSRMVKIDINEPRNQNRYVQETLNRPKFMQELTEPTAAEIGSGTHLVMQSIDLTKETTKEAIIAQIEALVRGNILVENVAKKIDTTSIATFFDSPIGQLMKQNPSAVKREAPFSLLLNAEEIFTDIGKDGTDKILVHGIIDGYIEGENELILFDFKTDYIPKNNHEAKEKILQKYKGQVNLYRRALSQALNREVDACYLYLFSLDEAVLIE